MLKLQQLRIVPRKRINHGLRQLQGQLSRNVHAMYLKEISNLKGKQEKTGIPELEELKMDSVQPETPER
jgi:hypothetical protein